MDGIVTLIDAKHIEQHLDEKKPEGVENEAVEQVAFADRLILNKCDLVEDEASLARVEGRLRALNAFAPILRSTKSVVDVSQVLDIKGFDLTRTLEMDPGAEHREGSAARLLPARLLSGARALRPRLSPVPLSRAEFLNTEGEHEHDSSVTSLSFAQPGDLNLDLLQGWIDTLLKAKGADIFRMKGVLSIAMCREKYVYQAVHMIFDGTFMEPWAAGEPRVSKLVFIGKNLDHDELKRSFAQCIATPENLRAAMEKKKLEERGNAMLKFSMQNDPAQIQALITAGASASHANGVGQTALHIAALWGNVEACTVLVKNGANLNAQNTMSGGTPLHMAAGSKKDNVAGRLKCAKLIVEAGADVTITGFDGRMAWQEASDAGEQEIAAVLCPPGTMCPPCGT